jgi:hypothetical protein
MRERSRQNLIAVAIVLGLTVLATPASAANWFSFHIGGSGVGLSFGSADWWIYGDAWSNPHWMVNYDTVLTGYGEWIWVAGLGRVWQPYVAAGWRPFTHGRWVHTGFGWTWVSYEPWGYFPHHYGRWANTHHGWVWVPGYTYRAANVVWVHWGGYVGWYPCSPRGWSHAARGYHPGYRHGYHNGYDDGYRHGWQDAEHATYVRWNRLSSDDLSRHATARIAQREMQVGGRTVTVARPEGMGSSVQRNGLRTVERALSPEVSRRVTNRASARSKPGNLERPDTGSNGANARRSQSGVASSHRDRSQTSRRQGQRPPDSRNVERSRKTETLRRNEARTKPPGTNRAGSERTRAPANTRSKTLDEAARRRVATENRTGRSASKGRSPQRKPSSVRQQRGPSTDNARQKNVAAQRRAAPDRSRTTVQGRQSEAKDSRRTRPRTRTDVSDKRSSGTSRERRR